MKLKLEKKLKIVNELITCFHKLGGDKVTLDLDFDGNNTSFIIKGKITNLSEIEVEGLSQLLNTPRQHEVEQYYWNLNGESELDCELSLVGMMVDEAELTYNNDILTIKIKRIDE